MKLDGRNCGGALGLFRSKWVIVLGVAVVLSSLAAMLFVPSLVFKNRCRESMEGVLKTRVEIGSADVSFSRDGGVIYDVTVYNPEGYPDRPFLVVPKVTFKRSPNDAERGMPLLRSIELHEPVMYLETAGESSNLKEVMANMMIPMENPPPPVKIVALKITNGSITSYPADDGIQRTSPFPIQEVRDLEGRPGKIAMRIATELQKSMDKQMKDTVKSLKKDLIKGFSELFDF